MLFFLFLTGLCTVVVGQTIPGNTVAIGLDASAWYNLNKENPSGRIYLAPSVTYYVFNDLGVGLSGGFDFGKTTTAGLTTITTDRVIRPYVRWFFYRGLALRGGTEVDMVYNYSTNVYGGLSYSFFFGHRWALEPLFEVKYDFGKYAIVELEQRISLGLHYYFK